MLIRRLVIASLLASATAAHADTITTQAAPPSGVVSGWTTSNGTDVLSSGVLQSNLNLVAGVAHGAGASLADALFSKVSNNGAGQSLVFQQGIEANYLLASGHGILAATAGLGMSVVGSADGAVISSGGAAAPGLVAGGGSNQTVSGGGTNGGGTSGGGTNGGGTNGGGTNNGGTGGNGGQAGGNGNQPEVIYIPPQANKPNDNGLAIPSLETPEASVPEPSSIALMLLGMMGAGAVARRRTR